MADIKYGRTMPNDLIFVRHGESEANIVQRSELANEIHERHDDIAFRADWQQRMTEYGIEQAKAAAKWIASEAGGIDSFDGQFVSPFLRARETAGYLGGDHWVIDDRIIERFLGVYGVVSYENAVRQAELANIRDASPWYARLDSAESLQDVFNRYRGFQNSLRRHHAGGRVIVVSHGALIKAARYAIEWALPEQFLDSDTEISKTVPNGAIVHYSRVNPYDSSDVRPSINWLRIVYPFDPDNSPNSGEWRELEVKRNYSAQELLDSVDVAKPIL